MRTIAGSCSRLCLFLCLLLLLASAVLSAEAPLPSGDERELPGCKPSRLLTSKETEAVFAKTPAPAPADFLSALGDNPGSIILWDEGPVNGAGCISNTAGIKN